MNQQLFQSMRRNKQELTDPESRRILDKATSGVLALLCNNGYPYAVPLSFVLHENVLYFHSATEGQKIEAVKYCEKASFCVIEQDKVIPEKFTTAYRSVITFGKIRIVNDADERHFALKLLADKYSPQVSETNVNNAITSGFSRVTILRFEIEHLSGKQGQQTMETPNDELYTLI